MKVLDLFSGIGGFSLGLERAGMQTVAFCEIEEYPRRVLKKHWPDVPIFEDVRKLKGEQVGTVELICGGYPCQPFSTAGQRRGTEDDRHLWPEYLRLIREIRPRWVIAENVAGHISMGLDEVLSDLESEGYKWEAFIIPACALNAWHRRDRVWIIANTGLSESQRWIHSEKRQQPGGRRDSWSEPASLGVNASNTDSARRKKQHPANFTKEQRFNSGPINTGWSQWKNEPGVDRVADGIPSRVDRIRALGNAVVPQIPEIIGRAIMAIEGF